MNWLVETQSRAPRELALWWSSWEMMRARTKAVVMAIWIINNYCLLTPEDCSPSNRRYMFSLREMSPLLRTSYPHLSPQLDRQTHLSCSGNHSLQFFGYPEFQVTAPKRKAVLSLRTLLVENMPSVDHFLSSEMLKQTVEIPGFYLTGFLGCPLSFDSHKFLSSQLSSGMCCFGSKGTKTSLVTAFKYNKWHSLSFYWKKQWSLELANLEHLTLRSSASIFVKSRKQPHFFFTGQTTDCLIQYLLWHLSHLPSGPAEMGMSKMTVPRLLCIQGSGCDSVSACDGRRLESRNELGGKRGDLPGNPLAGASHGVALELQLWI